MSQHGQLSIYRTASGYLFRIVGRGTMRESPAVRDFAFGAFERGAGVVLDLSACQYLDSTFLGCLLLLHQRAKAGPACFAILADDQVRQKLLCGPRLDMVLNIVQQPPECHGDPVTLRVSELDRSEFCRHLEETHRELAELGGPAAETFRCIADQLSRERRQLLL